MSDRDKTGSGPAFGGYGAALLLAGIVGYVLAADEGHWRATEIDGINCNPHEAGDNCAQYVSYAPSYVPHGGYAWLGWSALVAFAVGAVLLVVAIVRLGGIRGLRNHLTLQQLQ